MKKAPKKGRYNFLIDSSIYDKFSSICDDIGYVRSKQVEKLMEEFIARHKK